MFVKRLRIQNLRCLADIDCRPDPNVNLIVGDNASGKSTVLEALFFLGRGQSFRQSDSRESIRTGSKEFVVYGDVGADHGGDHRIAVQRARNGATRFRCDGEPDTTRLDLVNLLPVQLIDPNVHRLLEQGPRYRRQFMDWGVFHVEHDFFPAWRRYRRALKQRNRALRANWPAKDTVTWDAELVRHGEIVNACRRAYVRQLDTHLPESTHRILGDKNVTLSYQCGWQGDQGLGAALAGSLEKDRRAGFTQQGPHRADLKVGVAKSHARDWVSRGQQKILTAALLLVQARLLRDRRAIGPVLLIDDVAAELGATYRETLCREIQALGVQCFLTFLDAETVADNLQSAKTFHVEQGRLTPVAR